MAKYTALAEFSDGLWGIKIPELVDDHEIHGYTQAESFDTIEQEAIDYIVTYLGVPPSEVAVRIESRV